MSEERHSSYQDHHYRNVETQSMISSVNVKDAVQHVKWNYNGSLLASSTKDKMLRLIDPRAKKVSLETQGHEGSKGTKIEWLGGNVQPAELLFTAGREIIISVILLLLSLGFEKGPGRECALWDTRNFSKP